MTDHVRRGEESAIAQQRITRVARLATMGEMAAGVAHEINQPLTAISTLARACERYLDMSEPDFAELRDAVHQIGTEGLRAGEIIRRLREMVRNVKEPDERQTMSVNALIDDLRPVLNAEARSYETRLELALSPNLPTVDVDRVQIQQVLLNLVRNAFEALADIPADRRHLKLSTVREIGGNVEIRVSDNGPGIASQIAGQLFEPFCTSKASGTGLGLAISRTIVQSHKGTIGVRPGVPGETTFFIQLPATSEKRQ